MTPRHLTGRCFVGEPMHGAAIDIELPIGVRVVHFLDEGRHLRRRAVWIQRAVADEDPRLDPSRFCRTGSREAAVHGDDAGEIGAAPGQFENGRSAEAIPDGGDTAVNLGLRGENVDPRLGPGTEDRPIRAQLRDPRHDALTIAGDAVAAHVAGEGDISKLGEPVRPALGMRIASGAAVHDENAGARI